MERSRAWLELAERDPEYIFSDQRPLNWPVQTHDYGDICAVVVNTFDKLVGFEADHVIELGDETISLTELLKIKRDQRETEV